MLEKIDLDLKLDKQEYKARKDAASDRLTILHRAVWEANIPVIWIFEGWDAAGKGSTINYLAQQLDPRGFRIHAIKKANKLERQMPWLWRFWLRTPKCGEIAIFDRSWYGRVLVERVEELIGPEQWQQAYQDILDFERTLASDGTVIGKFFLHISQKEQKRRFKNLENDPNEEWRVEKEDWEHHKKYDKYLVAIEEMLARTDTEWGPWTIVEATDRRWSRMKVVDTCIRQLEEALQKIGREVPPLPPNNGSEPVNEPALDETSVEEAPHAGTN